MCQKAKDEEEASKEKRESENVVVEFGYAERERKKQGVLWRNERMKERRGEDESELSRRSFPSSYHAVSSRLILATCRKYAFAIETSLRMRASGSDGICSALA